MPLPKPYYSDRKVSTGKKIYEFYKDRLTRNPQLFYDLVKLGLMENFGAGLYIVNQLINELENWNINFLISDIDFIGFHKTYN